MNVGVSPEKLSSRGKHRGLDNWNRVLGPIINFPYNKDPPKTVVYCLVLSRDGGKWVTGTVIGDYIRTTIRIHSRIPY